MNFVWFPSKNLGINVERIEWYHLIGGMLDTHNLEIIMDNGKTFFIQDDDEVNSFLALVSLMEWEEENETESE